ncbi:MAG: flagellin [Deltaproteobacteria bacterium]|nr:flagellin [Deltaproteobacteria bacterium]
MGLRINTNVLSLTAQRNLGITAKSLSRALERLASGSRINRAGDDAAGLAISEGLNSQVRGFKVAVRNANDAIGFLNTAEGALANLTNITQRLRELGIQAANGTLGATDRSYLDSEKSQLLDEFDRIARQTDFNGVKLLDGSFTTTDLQVGVSKGDTISFTIGNARSSSLGALASISGVQHALTATNNAIVITGPLGTVNPITTASAADDTVSYSGNSFSAIAIARRINNQSGSTGVYADVQANIVQLNNMTFSGILTTSNQTLSAGQFLINNVSVTGNVSTLNNFITAINNVSSSTGVKASLATGTTANIVLTAADGRNITFAFTTATVTTGGAFLTVGFSMNLAPSSTLSTATTFSAGAITSAGIASTTITGAIKLRSAGAITLSGTNISQAIGVAGQSIAIDTSTAVNTISLATQASSQNSLAVLDATLQQLNTLRSSLGAVQSRLDLTVNNASVVLENLSAARSQIRDTDVAAETAELTRAQILQQAGVAVLGQANTSSQIALQLLRF